LTIRRKDSATHQSHPASFLPTSSPVQVFEITPTMNSALKALFFALVQLQAAEALDNGIGRKPHMGWSSWVRDLHGEVYVKGSITLLTPFFRMLPNVIPLRPNMQSTQQTSSSPSVSRTWGMSVGRSQIQVATLACMMGHPSTN
jgi:hypothetical protein